MLQLKNNSPFAAKMALLANEQGIDTLYIIVKATFEIGPQWTLVDEQPTPLEADVYWAEPAKSSVKYASDYHLGKVGTDIVMLGHACAPTEKSVNHLDVMLSVGAAQKTVRVFGDRHWDTGKISSAKPFKTMPLVYEKAFGGVEIVNGQIHAAEQRNPVGCGYAGERRGTQADRVPLPNLEDPAQLIREPGDCPVPAGFGFIAPNWAPRSTFAGTYDENWQTQRAPFLPDDFDKRFFSMAHPDLVYSGYLQGGEPVQMMHMHPNSHLQFNLPRVNLTAKVFKNKTSEEPLLQLETLLLEPNQLQLSMTWKAAVVAGKHALKINEVTINLSR